jgi:glycosyltransferase involved in cell wall biosynthesis
VLSILMPIYDEIATAEQAIDAVLATELPVEVELVVVDDGSTDGTRELLRELAPRKGFQLVEHERNAGKGAAVRTALAHANGDLAAIFDADLEYLPSDFELLLPPLLAGEASAVFGVRAFDGATSHSFLFVMGNRAVTLVANLLFNVYLRDVMTCHKVIRTDLFRSLALRSRGFEIEPEIAARLIQHGERILEVPIHYRARSHAEGKKLVARDGLRVVATLLRCRLRPA